LLYYIIILLYYIIIIIIIIILIITWFTLIGITALHSICEKGDLEIIKLLLENGANINALDSSLKSPLFYLINGTVQSQNEGNNSFSPSMMQVWKKANLI
jgi:hypothetical protein